VFNLARNCLNFSLVSADRELTCRARRLPGSISSIPRRASVFVFKIAIAVLSLSLVAGAQSEPACVKIDRAKDLLGQEGCVVARVISVNESQSGNTYLNMCEKRGSCEFSAVLLRKHVSQVGDLHELAGHEVEFRGAVTMYNGKPEMLIKQREQLRVTNAPVRMSHKQSRTRFPGRDAFDRPHVSAFHIRHERARMH
jgi:hypothetical protein